jgi:3-phosphoshikimate 1-carboxyvinyltransferase
LVVERIGRDVRISRAGPVVGTAPVPGSKSLTNRYLACAALAGGTSAILGASLADDAHAMIDGLAALGVDVDVRRDDAFIRVIGSGGSWRQDEARIDVGNAGTAMRFLTGLACLGYGEYRLDGSPRMRERPIADLVDALRALGARIEYEQREGYPPLRVHAEGLAGGEAALDSPRSSQFISALLMVAPYARRDVFIRIDGDLVSEPYIDMTLDVMREMGVDLVDADGRRFVVPAVQRYRPGEFTVEPDASAATYFWAAAAVTGGRVTVCGLTRASRQGDVRFVDVLARMGCTVDQTPEGLCVTAPANRRLQGVTVDLNAMPDTVQTLAVVALFADGPTRIDNVANLRIKETDRIAALVSELSKLGATVAPRSDGLTICPPPTVTPAEIKTYDDHRMAMSCAIAGLGAGAVTIRDAGCVSKSFPGYFDALAALCQSA